MTGSTEADPLKKGEEIAVDGATEAALPKKSKLWRLSHWRSAAFFLSLFLCLTVVFAFSFVIPCPVRPQYLPAWNRTFPQAATYSFLALEYVSKDKVMDVLFVRKDAVGSENTSCVQEGLSSPCVFFTAVTGTSGETLWERPLAPDFHWAQCGLGETQKGCLLSHADLLTAIDKHNGVIIWQRTQPGSRSSSLPVLSVPDLDRDGVNDVALVIPGLMQTRLAFLSGRDGDEIGSEVVLDSSSVSAHLMHATDKGSQYVLLQNDLGLYGLALWRIASQAKPGMETSAGLKKDVLWEKKASAFSGLVPIYESDSVRHVVQTGQAGSLSNLLIVTGDCVEMIDGSTLRTLWKVNTSSVFNKPTFGNYNKDSTRDVVIEQDVGNDTKRVMILDGETGTVLWEVSLLTRPNTPQPASINTVNSFSVFIFWGEMPSENRSASFSSNERFSYMLHPRYSQVLLEKTNVVDHIVAFKATLLERGRHACYLLLTGPESEGPEGTVTLSKWKLKADVPESRVVRIGAQGTGETDQVIREAFNRLRFSDEQ